MDKIKFAIVGFGNIGRRHAEHILTSPAAELGAVCDIKQELKEKAPGSVSFYSTIAEMLEASEVDVLCVCTPNYLHEPHTILGLEAGCHVVVEKPMAISVEQCDNMISASQRTGKLIFSVKQKPLQPTGYGSK